MNATIPLEAVRNALMCAVIKQKSKGREVSGQPHARAAAYTSYPPLLITGRALKYRPWLANTPPLPPQHFGLLDHGDLRYLADEVRLFKGLAEVRKTWGCGIRALQAELKGAMR